MNAARFVLPLALAALAPTTTMAGAFSYGSYYEDARFRNCFDHSFFGIRSCILNFAAIPRGKRMIASQIVCSFYFTGADQIADIPRTQPELQQVFLASSTPGFPINEARRQDLPVVIQSHREDAYSYTVNVAARFLYGPTQRPIVKLEFTEPALGSMNCVLTGEIRAHP